MPNNGTYTYTYDAIDRLSAMTDPLGLDVTYSYNRNNQLISQTKENIAATSYAYDSMGNNVSVTDPMGAVTSFVYDIENNLISTTDPLGNSVSAVYDTLGRTTSVTDQLGEMVRLAYDPHNNIIGFTDAKNQVTAYTYDLVDNLTGIVDANGATVSYTYDSMGNLTSATNGNGKTSAYTYNLRGDLTSVTNPMGQVEQYRYDIAGKLTEYIKPSGITISYDYDKLNNLIKKTADDETPVAYAYDNMGFRVEMNDDIGEVTYEYDAIGNATKVVHHNGDTVRYTYDVFGRLSEIMYPDGYCTDYEYDLCDRLIKVTGRDGDITTYTYDANGNVTRCDRSNSTYTTYTYNARNELVLLENRRANKNNALLSSYAYEYDKNGYITKETEKVDSYTYVRTYTYDAVGQLVGYVETTNGKQNAKYEYSYDAAGNRTGMVYYDASNIKYWTDYVYDVNNELVTETYNYNKNKNKVVSTVTAYTYDIDGNLTTKNVGGSEVWQYLWTAESRLEAVTKGSTLLMAATYDGDNNRIFQISDASSSSKVHQDNTLKKEWKNENGNSFPWENGNGNGGNGTGHSNTGNGGTTNGGGHNHTGNNSDGLKHANCKQCVDDQSAFVQQMADETVSIDGKDYLPVGKPNSYKDYELIYYINDVTIENEQVLVEYGANGTATGTYEYGLQCLSVEYVNEAKEYYLYNGTGNVTQTTAQNGSIFLRYTYDPFGNVTNINAPMTVDIDDLNRYTYNGEDYDFNTGLQYLRARYYNTSTGSFISQDTYLGQIVSPISMNRYIYCNNNPVMYDDPSGYETIVVTGGHYHAEDPHDENGVYENYQYQFIETGLQQAVLSSQAGEGVKWLIADTGFTDVEKTEIREAAEYFGDGKISVSFISNSDQMINYINNKSIYNYNDNEQITEQRSEDPISNFYVFSHGILENPVNMFNSYGAISLGYNSEYASKLLFSSDNIASINTESFASDSYSYFYTCRSAVRLDANLFDSASFAELWQRQTGSTTVGATARTTYDLTRGNNTPNRAVPYYLILAYSSYLIPNLSVQLLIDRQRQTMISNYSYIMGLSEEAEIYRTNRRCYEILFQKEYKKSHYGKKYPYNIPYPAFHKPIIGTDLKEASGYFAVFSSTDDKE